MQEICGALLVAILYFLGQTGVIVRRGINTRKALRKAKLEAQRRGGKVTKRWHGVNRKATLYIFGPIIGWMAIYTMLFWLLSSVSAPIGVYIITLVVLVPAVLGFLGLVFIPTEEFCTRYFPITEEEKQKRVEQLVIKILNQVNFYLLSGNPKAIMDQVALLSLIEGVSHTEEVLQTQTALLFELNKEVYTHLVSLLTEREQQELDSLLDKGPTKEELDRFFAQRISNIEVEIAKVLLRFRVTHPQALQIRE